MELFIFRDRQILVQVAGATGARAVILYLLNFAASHGTSAKTARLRTINQQEPNDDCRR